MNRKRSGPHGRRGRVNSPADPDFPRALFVVGETGRESNCLERKPIWELVRLSREVQSSHARTSGGRPVTLICLRRKRKSSPAASAVRLRSGTADLGARDLLLEGRGGGGILLRLRRIRMTSLDA